MKICHVITRLIIGGAQENTVLTCKGLCQHGHEVTLISGPETGPEGSLWDQAEDCGCEVIRLDSLRRAVHPLRDWVALGHLKRLFLDIRPDIVHTHSSKGGVLGRLAAASAGVPTIIHTIHGMSFNRTQPTVTRLVYRAAERYVARSTSAFITVADAMIEQAVDARIAPRRCFHTIRSGIETERFHSCARTRSELRSGWGIAGNEIVVGTIARLFDNKGYEDILAAMPDATSRDPRLRFVWIGDGANRALYERRLEGLGLRNRVRLLGLVRPDEVAHLVRGFDIIVHASRWEGLPRALVQALLSEVPAISFDNDGAPEVVIHEQTGLLVPYGDHEKLGAAIAALANDAEARIAYGRRGRERCLEEYDWRKMVAKIEEVYERLTRMRGPR